MPIICTLPDDVNFLLQNPVLLTLTDNQTGRTAMAEFAAQGKLEKVEKILSTHPTEDENDSLGHSLTFMWLLRLAYRHKPDRNNFYASEDSQPIFEKAVALLEKILSSGSLTNYYSFSIDKKSVSCFEAIIEINKNELTLAFLNAEGTKFTEDEPFNLIERLADKSDVLYEIISKAPSAIEKDHQMAYGKLLKRLFSNLDGPNLKYNLINLLIRKEASLCFSLWNYATPFHWAVASNDNQLISIMMESPHCPWEETSMFESYNYTPMQLANQLADTQAYKLGNNAILNAIENKQQFLGDWLKKNRNDITETFLTIFDYACNQDQSLVDQFLPWIIHRLILDSSTSTSKSKLKSNQTIVEKLLSKYNKTIDSLIYKEQTPFQAVINSDRWYSLNYIPTLYFLMDNNADMTVTTIAGQTVVEQLILNHQELSTDTQRFLRKLVRNHPDIIRLNSPTLYNNFLEQKLFHKNLSDYLFVFSLHAQAHFRTFLQSDDSNYNADFFKSLLISESSVDNLSKVDHFREYRSAALGILNALVQKYRSLSAEEQSKQKTKYCSLLKAALKDPLFKSHAPIGAVTNKFYQRPSSAITEIQKLLATVEKVKLPFAQYHEPGKEFY